MLPLPRVWLLLIRRAVCGPWPSEGVPGRRPDTVAALVGFEPLRYPWPCLVISAGLMTPYLCCLAGLTSEPVRGEVGLEGGLETFSGIDEAGLKLSNCLEYLLFAGGVGTVLPELGGRGEPEDEGVYEKLPSRPANES